MLHVGAFALTGKHQNLHSRVGRQQITDAREAFIGETSRGRQAEVDQGEQWDGVELDGQRPAVSRESAILASKLSRHKSE